MKAVQCILPATLVNKVIPLRDPVVNRTAVIRLTNGTHNPYTGRPGCQVRSLWSYNSLKSVARKESGTVLLVNSLKPVGLPIDVQL